MANDESVQYDGGYSPIFTFSFMLAPFGNPIAAFYPHAHFISIVGAGEEKRTLIGLW